jgi:hypothetical protein
MHWMVLHRLVELTALIGKVKFYCYANQELRLVIRTPSREGAGCQFKCAAF